MSKYPDKLGVLSSVIQTKEDQEAFDAGYELARNPDYSATFGGHVGGTRDGVHIQLNIEDQSGTWLDGRLLPRNQDSVLVGDVRFVLGGLVAAIESKLSTGEEAAE